MHRRRLLVLGIATVVAGLALLAVECRWRRLARRPRTSARRGGDRRAEERPAEERGGRRARAAPGPPRARRGPRPRRNPLDRCARPDHPALPEPDRTTRSAGLRRDRLVDGRPAPRRPRPRGHRRPRRLEDRPGRVLPAQRAPQGRQDRRRPSDGSRARFIVQGSEQYPKADFPTARVYGRTVAPRCASSRAVALSTAPPATTCPTRSSTHADRPGARPRGMAGATGAVPCAARRSSSGPAIRASWSASMSRRRRRSRCDTWFPTPSTSARS